MACGDYKLGGLGGLFGYGLGAQLLREQRQEALAAQEMPQRERYYGAIKHHPSRIQEPVCDTATPATRSSLIPVKEKHHLFDSVWWYLGSVLGAIAIPLIHLLLGA